MACRARHLLSDLAAKSLQALGRARDRRLNFRYNNDNLSPLRLDADRGNASGNNRCIGRESSRLDIRRKYVLAANNQHFLLTPNYDKFPIRDQSEVPGLHPLGMRRIEL